MTAHNAEYVAPNWLVEQARKAEMRLRAMDPKDLGPAGRLLMGCDRINPAVDHATTANLLHELIFRFEHSTPHTALETGRIILPEPEMKDRDQQISDLAEFFQVALGTNEE